METSKLLSIVSMVLDSSYYFMKFNWSTSFIKFSISLSIYNLWYLSICIINVKYSSHYDTKTSLNCRMIYCAYPLQGKLYEIEICFDKNDFNVIHCNDYPAVYPPVQQNQQQLQQPQQHPLVQANEDQCQLLSNGQTQINFIAPGLQLMIILLIQLLIF